MDDNPQDRTEKVKHKFRQTAGMIKGKRLWIIEDSIVRGDVTRGLIPIIKEILQPSEIHMRVAWDQFLHPCYSGIDVPESKQLIAHLFNGNVEKIRERLGLTSLRFLPTATNRMLLSENSPHRPEEFCLACADGDYPTEYEKKRAGIIP